MDPTLIVKTRAVLLSVKVKGCLNSTEFNLVRKLHNIPNSSFEELHIWYVDSPQIVQIISETSFQVNIVVTSKNSAHVITPDVQPNSNVDC